jgi:signal transduction histidine kinase
VDFSKETGTIIFKAEGTSDTIRFCVVDSGNGFSAEALKSAKQQFYMGDKSRTSKSHYGMGLFIANTLAMQHGGSLVLDNSAETGGAKVTLEIPINVN